MPMTYANHREHRGATSILHQPEEGWRAAYVAAYAAAQPDAGRTVVPVNLEVRESEWEFQQARASRACVINGAVPGPTLEARVGDVLEIRFTNRMSEPTVLHWHGLRIPAAMDGTESVQRPVA